MGKVKFIIGLLFVSVWGTMFSQRYDVVYEVNFKPLKGDSIMVKENYNLKIDMSSQESKFLPLKTSNSLNAIIYKNLNKKIFTKYQLIVGDLYKTNYDADFSNWTLVDNRKTIINYTCYQAKINFGGREWIAFYTLDIPMPDGPYKFYGLPGLILEIYSIDGHYHFLAKGIQKTDGIIGDIQIRANYLPSKEKELLFKKGVIKDPAAQYRKNILGLKSSNISVKVSFDGKESKSRDIEKTIEENFNKWIKAHDNPIEKEDLWVK